MGQKSNEIAIKALYASGMHVDEIANALNISIAEAYNGVLINSKFRVVTEEERKEMIYLHEELGLSISAVARITGRSRTCVRTRLKAPAKMNQKTRRMFTEKDIELLKNMVRSGHSVSDIARKFGVPRTTIRRRIANWCI